MMSRHDFGCSNNMQGSQKEFPVLWHQAESLSELNVLDTDIWPLNSE